MQKLDKAQIYLNSLLKSLEELKEDGLLNIFVQENESNLNKLNEFQATTLLNEITKDVNFSSTSEQLLEPQIVKVNWKETYFEPNESN
jgi:hypothetical protein